MLESYRREIAVLACDIRGFTPFSETAELADVIPVRRELDEAAGWPSSVNCASVPSWAKTSGRRERS